MKFLIAASLIVAASARNLEEVKPDYDAIATYEPYTDVRDQVMLTPCLCCYPPLTNHKDQH